MPGFFDLPLEIRIMIYRLALTNRDHLMHPTIETNISRRHQLCRDPLSLGPRGLSPHLLRVCKTIYDEALSTLYDENIFGFIWGPNYQPAMHHFFLEEPHCRYDNIKHLCVRIDWSVAGVVRSMESFVEFLSAENLDFESIIIAFRRENDEDDLPKLTKELIRRKHAERVGLMVITYVDKAPDTIPKSMPVWSDNFDMQLVEPSGWGGKAFNLSCHYQNWLYSLKFRGQS